jgi:LytS/YehU family sensor histidine kinase
MSLNGKYRYILHSLLWIVFFLIIAIITHGPGSFWSAFAEISLDGIFYIFIVYFNIFYLFPLYGKSDSLVKYIALLLVTVILMTPVKGAAMYLFNITDLESRREVLLKLHYTFLSTFMVAGLSTVGKMLFEWVSLQRERKKLERETLQSELKFLKNQINPHFLFNTLNNIYSLALVKSDLAPEVILKLSEILRYMLYECNEPKVKLTNEVSYIKNYLDLEKLRQKDDVMIEFTTEGDIEEQLISPMLFTPFLENAFKHGINRVIKDACVKVYLKVHPDSLFFSVQNTKPEFEPNAVTKKQGGIGLANVRKRLELLYPGKYSLEIQNTLTRYIIELKLNLN